MRVTQAQLQSLALTSVSDSRSRLQRAQIIAASGAKVSTPKDDPAASARARLFHELMAEAERHESNAAMGNLRLQRAEQALSEFSTTLMRLKELALTMASDTINGDQRNVAADEVDSLLNSMVDLANTRDGDEYVFATIATTTAPVTPSGTMLWDFNTYTSVRQIEVGPTALAEIGSSASMAFAQRVADPSSVDVFAVVQRLSTALRPPDDVLSVRTAIDELDDAFNQVVAERSRVGIRQNRLELARSSANQSVALYRTLESELIDADAAEAFSTLTLAETSLQAAITVASRVLGPSLLDAI